MEASELSIVINQPINEVFIYLANLENDAKWQLDGDIPKLVELLKAPAW